MADVAAHLQARLLSSLVTRVIKAPDVALTTREVGEPETVLVPTRHGDVRCFVTRAAADAPLSQQRAVPPVHINIHGGAFLIGAPRQDDHLVRCIAGEVGATVVNIDYSTAPRARYPQAHEECFDVLSWARTSGASMGWDDQRVSIGGGSAGGNLALAALELARRAGDPPVRAAALLMPSVDQTIPAAEHVSPLRSANGSPLRSFVNPRLVRSIEVTYFADASRRGEVLASPVLSNDELAALPPLLVIGADRDALRPQYERFVAKARHHGIPVTYQCFDDLDHDFPVRPNQAGTVALRELGHLMAAHLMQHLAK